MVTSMSLIHHRRKEFAQIGEVGTFLGIDVPALEHLCVYLTIASNVSIISLSVSCATVMQVKITRSPLRDRLQDEPTADCLLPAFCEDLDRLSCGTAPKETIEDTIEDQMRPQTCPLLYNSHMSIAKLHTSAARVIVPRCVQRIPSNRTNPSCAIHRRGKLLS